MDVFDLRYVFMHKHIDFLMESQWVRRFVLLKAFTWFTFSRSMTKTVCIWGKYGSTNPRPARAVLFVCMIKIKLHFSVMDVDQLSVWFWFVVMSISCMLLTSTQCSGRSMIYEKGATHLSGNTSTEGAKFHLGCAQKLLVFAYFQI